MQAKTRVAFWSCVTIAVVVVAGGWLFTASGRISGAARDVKLEVSQATSAASALSSATSSSLEPVVDAGTQMKDAVVPYVRAAIAQQQAMDVVTERVKEQLNR